MVLSQNLRNSLRIFQEKYFSIFHRELSTNGGISFALTKKQKELQQLVRKFVCDEVIPVAKNHDKTGEYPCNIIKRCWELGFLNGHIPKDYGGPGLDVQTNCLISEEIGYGCAGVMITMEVHSIAQTPVIRHANEELKQKYLGHLTGKPSLAAFAVTEENAGSDVGAITTKAECVGNEYILNGEKSWIINADQADWYFVLARTSENKNTPASKAFTGFIVERNSEGIKVCEKEENLGQRASDVRSIRFENVRVPKCNIVGKVNGGFKIVMETFDRTRPLVAAGATGLAKRCLDECLHYSSKRKTFKVPICNHQAIAFMLADMAIGVETSRLSYQKAAWDLDNNVKNSYTSSIAKCYAADTAVKIAVDAVQIFGATGYSSSHPVEKFLRDAKAFQILGGTSQIQRVVISRKIINELK